MNIMQVKLIKDCSQMSPLRFLNDGDVVELEIEKIGVISNKVTRR